MTPLSGKERDRLDEVTILHCVLAVLIVFMHSFTCYNGGWPTPSGYIDVPIYRWLSRISFAATLETFVFISGYLLSHQLATSSKYVDKHLMGGGKILIHSKLKRLIIPSIIFSIPYFFVFYDYKGMVDCVYHIIAGCGHMWFLPMLFWCFIFGWIILNLRVNDVYMMALLLLLYIVPVPFSIPFQVGKVPEFMCFFYAGVIAYKYRSQLLSKTKGKTIVALWGIFMILFVGLKCIDDIYIVPEKTNAGYFMIYDIYSNILSLVYKSVGVITLFLTALWTTTKCTTNNFLQIFASCSFGIYIFQQFILKYLYYKTPFPEFVGPYWLPWLGFVMVLLISFLCAFYLRKLKIGKFLLG